MRWRWFRGDFSDVGFRLDRGQRRSVRRLAWRRYADKQEFLLVAAVLAALGLVGVLVPQLLRSIGIQLTPTWEEFVALVVILLPWPVIAWVFVRMYTIAFRRAMWELGYKPCMLCGFNLEGLHGQQPFCPECGPISMQYAQTTPVPGVPAVAVLLSGSGRTLQNLFEHIAESHVSARVVLVIASRECRGAEIAREAGIRTEVIPGVIPASRLAALLRETGAEWVVLAGYLKKLDIPPDFAGRIVNIHPALLPDFGGPGMYGEHVHKAVLAAGRGESGCSVHLVTDEYDRGPIILQARCPVRPGDDPVSLAARVFEVEKRTYPEALQLLFSGRVQVGEDGRVTILPQA